MDVRGQISAEYLLLIVVIIVIISFVTIPFAGRSIDASNDISFASDAKNAVSSIANAVNLVYSNGPEAKRTIDVYIPQNGLQLSSNSTNLWINTTISNNGTKQVIVPINYPVTVNPSTLNKGWYHVTVYWTVGSTSINVNMTAS